MESQARGRDGVRQGDDLVLTLTLTLPLILTLTLTLILTLTRCGKGMIAFRVAADPCACYHLDP